MKLKVKREVFYNHKKCAIEFNIEGPGRIGYCDNISQSTDDLDFVRS